MIKLKFISISFLFILFIAVIAVSVLANNDGWYENIIKNKETFINIDINGKVLILNEQIKREQTVLILPAEYNLLSNKDNSKYYICLDNNLWEIDAYNKLANQITYDHYDGKSFEEINSYFTTSDETKRYLMWINKPVINNEGSCIIYSSNRNHAEIAPDGISIWKYDISSNKEYMVMSFEHHVNIIGWINNSWFLLYDGIENSFILADLNAKIINTPINSMALVMAIKDNMIFASLRDAIAVYSFTDDEQIILKHKFIMDSGIILPNEEIFAVSPDMSKIAFASIEKDMKQPIILKVYDLNEQNFIKNINPKQIDLKTIRSVYWEDSNMLSVICQTGTEDSQSRYFSYKLNNNPNDYKGR